MPQPDSLVVASGDEAFLQLNALLTEVQEARAAVGLVRRRARRVLPGTVRLLWHLRRLPVLHVTTSDSHDGRVIAAALGRRLGVLPATVAAAALELPARPEDYLVGRSMQAVRTGVNHARRQGLQVLKVTDGAERRARALDLVGTVGADFDSPLRAWASSPHGDSWFVVDSTATTRAVAVLNIDGPTARLDTVISARGADQSSARYLLSAEVFKDLITQGVSHVFLEGSLFLPPGLLHFQRRLGFRQVNIKLHRAAPQAAGVGATRGRTTRRARSAPEAA